MQAHPAQLQRRRPPRPRRGVRRWRRPRRSRARASGHPARANQSASAPRPAPTSTSRARSGSCSATCRASALGCTFGIFSRSVLNRRSHSLRIDPAAAEPAVEPAVRRARGLEVEGRVGHLPAGAVRRLEQLLGPGRSRQRAAGERAGAEREDPVLLEGRADLAHQVELAVEEVAAEDVEPAHATVGLDHVDLERGGAVAVDGVALLAQRALQPEGLADHVERVGVPADVAEVDVVVVADEVLLADGAEQGAVRRERVHPGLVQGRQHLLGRVEQRLDVLGVAGVEDGGDPVGLVDAERPTGRRRRRRSGRPWSPRRTSSSYATCAGDVLDDGRAGWSRRGSA